jgi:tetratricopeptide (TPR) repeat protein
MGWGISAGIAILMIGMMVALQWSGTVPSDMTGKFAADPKNLGLLVLEPSPDTVFAATEACDAAGKYQQAIDQFQENKQPYVKLSAKTLDQMPAVEAILEAASCKNFTLFTRNPAQVINFDREKKPIEALRALGEATAWKALALKAAGDKDGARRYAEAAFALGVKLYNERVTYEECEAGLAAMGAGGKVLMDLANEAADAGRAAQIKAFMEAKVKLPDAKARVGELHALTKSVDGNVSGRRAGDIFALAERSQERMWRVEACMQMGRMKKDVGEEGRAADQRHAQILLRRLADNEPDPIVRYAASRARDMTDEEYHRQ